MPKPRIKRIKVFTIGLALSKGLNIREALSCVLGERPARIYFVEGVECPDTCTCFSGEPYPETLCSMRWLGGGNGCIFVCEAGDRECIRAVKEKARASG